MQVTRHTLTTLGVAFSAAFAEGFGMAKPDHEPFTMKVPSATKKNEYGWLGQFGELREWVGERVLTGLKTHGYEIENKRFEKTVEVDRDDIEDDNVSIYAPLFTELGRAAAMHPCRLAYGLLKKAFGTKCYDGQFMVDTDHPGHGGASVSNDGGGTGSPWFLMDCSRAMKPVILQERKPFALTSLDALDDENVFMRNKFIHGVDGRCNVGFGLWQLLYGSKEPLTAARFKAAYEAMLAFAEPETGDPLGIMPTHLVCAPANLEAARKILKADKIDGGDSNIWMDSVELIATPWLS